MSKRSRRNRRRGAPPRPQPAAAAPAKSKPIRHWTAEEDEALEEAVWRMDDLRQAHRREAPSPMKRVATELGRTYGAVRSRAALLGLSARRATST